MNLSTFTKPTILTILSSLLSLVFYGQNPVFNLTSGNANPTVCSGTAITSIVFDIDNLAPNATPDPSVTFTPATGTGLTGTWTENNDTFTISGTPTGTISYDILATNNDGPTHQTGTITVTPSPTVADITGPTQVCVNASINLASTTPGGTWSSSNNTFATVNGSGTVTGASAGAVTISYAVTADGCTTTKTKAVTVVALPSVNPITGSSSVCDGSTITLSSTTNGGTWSSSNNAIATVNASSGLVTGIDPGAATITYTVTTNGCSTAVTKAVNVNSLPVLPAIQGPTSVCVGSIIQLTNTTPSGVWSTDGVAPNNATVNSSGQVTGVAQGTETIFYTFTDGNGCQDQESVVVTVTSNASIVLAGGSGAASQTICEGGSIVNIVYNLSNATGASVESLPSGLSGSYNSSNQTFTITGTATGDTGGNPLTYTVTSTGIGACSSGSAQGNITVNPKPAGTNQNATVCSGAPGSAALTTDIPSTFSWTVGTITGGITGAQAGSGSVLNFTLTNPSATNPGTVQYSIIPTSNPGGCAGNAFFVTVTVNPAPVISGISDVTVCSNSPVSIPLSNSSSLPSTFCWSIADNADAPIISGVQNNCGSTITMTPVNSSNSLQGDYDINIIPTSVSGLCPGSAFNVTVLVNPQPVLATPTGQVSSCEGSISIPLEGSVPSTFSWPAPSCGADVSGSLCQTGGTNVTTVSGSFDNSTANAVTVNIVVTPTATGTFCTGLSSTIPVLVKPEPEIDNYTDNNSYCSGVAFTDTPSLIDPNIVPTGTTYSWQTPQLDNGLVGGSAGSGNNISGQLTNNSTTVLQAIYQVTPSKDGCNGDVFAFTVNINPKPSVNGPIPVEICTGTALAFTPVNGVNGSIPGGTTYSWPAASGCATGVNSGSNATTISTAGNIVNNSASPCDLNVIITPTGPPALGSCPGSNFTVALTVNPKPVFSSYAETGCNGNDFIAELSELTGTVIPTGTQFEWTAPVWDDPSACLGISGDCGDEQTTPVNTIGDFLSHTTIISQDVVFSVTPYSSPDMGACAGSEFNVTFTVTPGPAIGAIEETFDFCNGEPIIIPSFTSTGNPTWHWECDPPTIGITEGNTNIIPESNAINGLPNNQITATVTVEATATVNEIQCVSSRAFNIIVSPTPSTNAINDVEYCDGIVVPSIVFGGTPVGNELTFDYAMTNGAAPFGLTPTSANSVLSIPSFEGSNNTPSNIVANFQVTPQAYGCTGAAESFNITIAPAPEPPIITDFLPDGPVCGSTNGQAFAAQASFSGASFNWTASGSMTVIAGSNNDVCMVNFTNPGSATLTVTAGQGGCASASSVTFDVTAAPQPALCAVITETPDGNGLVCLNNNVDSYQWGSIVVTAGDNWLESTLDQSGNGNDQFYYGQLLQDTVGKRIFVRICQDGCCTTTFYPDGCVEVPDLNVFTLSGSNAAFQVFPNPASEFLNITAPAEISGQTTMSLFDIAGNLIEQQFGYMAPSSTWRFDLSGFGHGMYFLRIKSNDGKDTTVKVIKN